ncbi:MAG: HAD hydrolase-like protein [Candidatus Accumulibacter sp.]|nr:HAD hydrolase-like protein [Accumulibacter sp.]
MALRAILFDVDGTLANTERDGHRPAFNAAFAELGLSWYWDESFYGKLLSKGGGRERLYFYAEHFDPATRARPDFDELMRRAHEIKTRNYQRLLAAGAIPLRGDVGRLICEARTEGVRLGIASSSRQENVAGLLRANLGPDADAWFDVIVTGESVSDRKSSVCKTDVYKKALEDLQLPGRDCLAVEDSAHGLAASLAAGIPTVITLSDYTHDENFEGARMVLHETDPLSLEALRLWHATASTS